MWSFYKKDSSDQWFLLLIKTSKKKRLVKVISMSANPTASVLLPLYEGYTDIVVWPALQSVSIIAKLNSNFNFN